MSLAHISLDQALDVWTDLVYAHQGKNGFGGDTAEIYIYRLMTYDPKLCLTNDACRQAPHYKEALLCAHKKANAALYDLLVKFAQDFDCVVEIMESRDKGRKLGLWFLQGEPYTHRVHVRIV